MFYALSWKSSHQIATFHYSISNLKCQLPGSLSPYAHGSVKVRWRIWMYCISNSLLVFYCNRNRVSSNKYLLMFMLSRSNSQLHCQASHFKTYNTVTYKYDLHSDCHDLSMQTIIARTSKLTHLRSPYIYDITFHHLTFSYHFFLTLGKWKLIFLYKKAGNSI